MAILLEKNIDLSYFKKKVVFMVLYLAIIFLAVIAVSIFNIIFPMGAFDNYSMWIILVMVLAVVVEIAWDGVLATIVHSLPEKWFEMDNKFYNVGKRERKFYEKLKIKSWKDKICELGALGGFRKNKVRDPNNPKYIKKFVVECNKGVMVHIVIMVFGFLIMLFPTPKYFLRIGLPVAVVNLFLNLLSTMVLRYNTPKLKIAYLRAIKTNEMKKEKNEEVKNEKN